MLLRGLDLGILRYILLSMSTFGVQDPLASSASQCSAFAGISSKTCETVLEAYPTPISLWRAYRATTVSHMQSGGDALAAANRLLTALPGVGPDTARSVFTTMFANGWHLTE